MGTSNSFMAGLFLTAEVVGIMRLSKAEGGDLKGAISGDVGQRMPCARYCLRAHNMFRRCQYGQVH